MTMTSTRERPDTQGMLLMHRVLTTEANWVPKLVGAVPEGNTERAAVAAGHYRDYAHYLHAHHTAEDEMVWPLLLARVDMEAEIVLRMEAQHETIERTMREIDEALTVWQAAPSRAAAEPVLAAVAAHLAVVREHLAEEEERVLPLIEEHLTVAEWGKVEKEVGRQTPMRKTLYLLGVILEDMNADEQATTMSMLPPPARLIWRVIGRRQFARRVAYLRADL